MKGFERGLEKGKLMKFLIVSDIHGDAECCSAMLDAFAREGAEKILILGDVLYHGPRNDLPAGYAPKRVIEMLNAISDKIVCVRGNCEAEVDQMVLSFPCMADKSELCDKERGINICMSHGHVYNPDKLPDLPRGSLFLYGHTHLLSIERRGGVVCLNPGSISIPKGGNPKSYAVYDGGRLAIKTLEGEILASESL